MKKLFCILLLLPALSFADFDRNDPADLAALKSEVNTDPLALGYNASSGDTGLVLETINLVRAQFTVSKVGVGNGWNFYADGAGADYGPFTGAHEALVPITTALEIGDIVVDKALIVRSGISNTLFEVELSTATEDARAVGVVSVIREKVLTEYRPAGAITGRQNTKTETDPPPGRVHELNENGKVEKWELVETLSPAYTDKEESHRVINMNSLGEGQVSVCNEGGDITAGDLITTSSKIGKGMKQVDGIVRNYSVAKARESVAFLNANDVKLVACIYLCG